MNFKYRMTSLNCQVNYTHKRWTHNEMRLKKKVGLALDVENTWEKKRKIKEPYKIQLFCEYEWRYSITMAENKGQRANIPNIRHNQIRKIKISFYFPFIEIQLFRINVSILVMLCVGRFFFVLASFLCFSAYELPIGISFVHFDVSSNLMDTWFEIDINDKIVLSYLLFFFMLSSNNAPHDTRSHKLSFTFVRIYTSYFFSSLYRCSIVW